MKLDKDFFSENIKTLFYALVIAIIIRSLLIQPFYIPSSSMEPTLLVGDRLFVTKYSYGYSKHSFPFSPPILSNRILFKSPKRGDVIVFRKPGDETIDYIKRLVALPNDTVQVKNGVLYINKKMVERTKSNVGIMKNSFGDEKTFIQYKETFDGLNFHEIIEASDQDLFDDTIEFKVPDNHFFFMGDNRDNSRDSRSPEVGFVPKRNLIGKAQIIFFSHNSSASIFEFWKWHKAIRFSRIGKAIE